jgi:concanavalin A-like lectin/glucanase superfamily protein
VFVTLVLSFWRPGLGPAVRAADATCVDPPSGLIGWWPGDGNPNDIRGGHHGTLAGNVAYAAGEVGQSFSFDGSNGGGVALGNAAAFQLQDFTIDAWVKRSSTEVAGNGPSSEGGILVYGHDGYGMGLLPDGQIFLTKVDVDNVASGASMKVTDTDLHHVAVTKSGSSVVFYLDGTAGSTITYGSTFAFTKNLSIGARLDVSSPSSTALTATFAGQIDEVELFNRALTATEVQSIADAGGFGKCKPGLDVDGDGELTPLTDGLLVLRYEFGFTDAALITGAVDLENCTRCSAEAIANYLMALSVQLDIDDNDELGPLSDGLLVLRWLFGFTDNALTGGVVDGASCERCTAAAIAAYIESIGGG